MLNSEGWKWVPAADGGTLTLRNCYIKSNSAEVRAVTQDKSVLEQDTVNGYATAIINAISSLQYKGADITLNCTGRAENLTGVYVDGKLVEKSNYTVKSGSTILTLKASYLDTLMTGEHKLEFQYYNYLNAETLLPFCQKTIGLQMV